MKRTIVYAFGFAATALIFATGGNPIPAVVCIGFSLMQVRLARREIKLIKAGKLPA